MQIWPLCIFAITAEVVSEITTVQTVERLTLVGALTVAVAVLWKTKQKKDDLFVENSKQTVQALITSSEATRRMAEANTRMAESNEKLSEAIDRLQHSVGTLPCTKER